MPANNIPSMDEPILPAEGTEDYWRAQSDARTLTEAEAVKADAKRTRFALAVLKKDAEARDKALAQLKKAAKKDQ